MSSKRRRPRRNSARSPVLFVVADQQPPLEELIDWPDDPAEAAAIIAACEKISAQHATLEAQGHNYEAWQERTDAVRKALTEYERAHADEGIVDGRYTDDFRRFVLSLARGPGEGMSLLKLSTVTGIEEKILAKWLSDGGEPRH